MAIAVTASGRKTFSSRVSGFEGLTLEAEIRSLHSLAPESVAQLHTLFADAVVKSCSSVLGDTSGEALIRRIGDERLRSPDEVYGRVDALLGGGSETLKNSIRSSFRSRVHRLYRITMSVRSRPYF
jgi:hypothetical protein